MAERTESAAETEALGERIAADLLYELITHQGRNAKQNNVTIEMAELKK